MNHLDPKRFVVQDMSEVSDNAITLYLNMIAQRNRSTPGALKIHAFDAHFYELITQGLSSRNPS